MPNPASQRGSRFRSVCAFLATAASLEAQAWLFPKGEGTVSLSYQYIFVRQHYYSKAEAVDSGHIFSHAMTLDTDYSLTDKFALRLAVPFVAAKYVGTKPHQLSVDSGRYHSSFQDFAIDARYNVRKRPFVLTPFVRVVIPSNHYAYFAHSAVGLDVREYHLGTSIGRRLNPVLPKAYLQGRYSYAFVERIEGIRPNRSEAEFQMGYFLNRRLSLLGQGRWVYTHAGVDHTYGVFHSGLPDNLYYHHDQIGLARLFDVSGGASYVFNQSLVTYVSLGHSLQGRNTHAHAAVVTVGFGRNFGGGESRKAVARASAPPEPQKSLVCTCVRTK